MEALHLRKKAKVHRLLAFSLALWAKKRYDKSIFYEV